MKSSLKPLAMKYRRITRRTSSGPTLDSVLKTFAYVTRYGKIIINKKIKRLDRLNRHTLIGKHMLRNNTNFAICTRARVKTFELLTSCGSITIAGDESIYYEWILSNEFSGFLLMGARRCSQISLSVWIDYMIFFAGNRITHNGGWNHTKFFTAIIMSLLNSLIVMYLFRLRYYSDYFVSETRMMLPTVLRKTGRQIYFVILDKRCSMLKVKEHLFRSCCWPMFRFDIEPVQPNLYIFVKWRNLTFLYLFLIWELFIPCFTHQNSVKNTFQDFEIQKWNLEQIIKCSLDRIYSFRK